MTFRFFSVRRLIWVLVVFLSVAAAAGIGITVLVLGIFQHQWDASFVRSVAGILRIPAARVGQRTISYTTYLTHADAEQRYLSGPAARAQGLPVTMTAEYKSQALDRAIRIAAVDEFAQARGVVVTPLDVDRVYDSLIAQAGTSTTPEEIHNFLRDEFGWDENDFKTFVVRPALTEDILKQKELQATKDANAFDKEMADRLKKLDVVRYLKF